MDQARQIEKACARLCVEARPRLSLLFTDGSPNISVNADVRELAFVRHRAGACSIAPVNSLAARGRRLP
jgi:hypothetical protein